MSTLLEQTRTRLDAAARLTEMPDRFLERLSRLHRTQKTTLEVSMDDGTFEFFEAWHCVHGEVSGPLDASLQIRSSATIDEVEALALLETIKGALLGLPFGGAAAAVRADRSTLSAGELDRLKVCFAERHCSTGRTAGHSALAAGGFAVLQGLSAGLRLPPGAKVAIAGLGRVGSHIAKLLGDAGYAIVAAADSTGGVVSGDAIAVSKLLAAKRSGVLGAVSGQRGVARTSTDAVIGADCDLLVVAGPPGAISRGNARAVRAGVLLELADGGVDAAADDILDDRGTVVVPDILAAVGAAAERHLMRDTDRVAGEWSPSEVDEGVAGMILPTARMAWRSARTRGVTLRTAGSILALERLAVSEPSRAGASVDFTPLRCEERS